MSGKIAKNNDKRKRLRGRQRARSKNQTFVDDRNKEGWGVVSSGAIPLKGVRGLREEE